MKTMGTFLRSGHRIASYSSKGPTLFDHIVKPDIVAPGNRVASIGARWSTLYNLYPANCVPLSYYSGESEYEGSGNTYFRLSGTSMAAPMASGAAALLLQKVPQLTPDQVKARLMKTAGKTFPRASISVDPVTGRSYVSHYDLFTVGAGYLDIGAAISSSDVASGSAMSPRVVVDPVTGAVTLVTDASLVWGTSPPWSTSVVWGTNVLLGTSVVWGTSLVWELPPPTASASFWGGSVIWGTLGPASSDDSILIAGEN
jgi:serine protease AprX